MDNRTKEMIIDNLISDINESILSSGEVLIHTAVYSGNDFELNQIQGIDPDEVSIDDQKRLIIYGGDDYLRLDLTNYTIEYDDDVDEYIMKNGSVTCYVTAIKGSENFS